MLFLAFLTFTSGCKKDKEQPLADNPADHGKISFLINGLEWQSEPGSSRLISTDNDTFPGVRAAEYQDSLSLITCRNSDSSVFGLDIFLLYPGRTGEYRDSTRKTTYMTFYETVNDPTPDQIFVHKKMRLQMTSWDPAKRRFSGTFQAELRSISGTRTLLISNGKFENVLFEKQ